MTELEELQKYLKGGGHISPSTDAMALELEKVIGYSQRAGECKNEAERYYSVLLEEVLTKLSEDETETTRQAKVKAWTSEAKKNWEEWKTIVSSLKALRMSLHQAIKTEREQPFGR